MRKGTSEPGERMNIIVWMKHIHTYTTHAQREIGTPLCNTAGDKMRPGNNRKEVIQTHTHTNHAHNGSGTVKGLYTFPSNRYAV